MVQEGRTGLTLRESTYEYVTDGRKGSHSWNEVIVAGMDDIEERDAVNNSVTNVGSDTNSSQYIDVDSEIHAEVKQRKKAHRLNITWDDIAVHGARRLAGESVDGLSEQAKEDVREIVDERIDERIGDLEETLERELADVEAGVDDDRAKEIARDVSRAAIKEMVADGAIHHHHL